MRLLLLLAFSLTVSGSVHAQLTKKQAQDTIVWKKDSLLVKENFQSKKSMNAPAYASTAIYLYQKEVNGNLMFYVEALFLKSTSFMKDESAYILNHEQLHFDICELHARKLRQKIAEKDFAKVRDIVGEIQRMYHKTVNEWQNEEVKYDKDTQHGINAAKQNIWDENIRSQIIALDSFSSTAVDIVKK